MTITNTYRWNGRLGSDWNAGVRNPPGPDKTNWDNISDISANPSFPHGAGDLALIDLGGAITITDTTPGGAEEMQIVNASTVNFSSGFFSAGADGEQGRMLIDEDATLILGGGPGVARHRRPHRQQLPRHPGRRRLRRPWHDRRRRRGRARRGHSRLGPWLHRGIVRIERE
jgi:hypothetical protein